jgi:hypothetical protein
MNWQDEQDEVIEEQPEEVTEKETLPYPILIPLDRFLLGVNYLIRQYQGWRMTQFGKLPKIKELEIDAEQTRVILEKSPDIINIGAALMTTMNAHPDAVNYMEITAMAPDGEIYTLLVSRLKGKPQSQIIDELKQELRTILDSPYYEEGEENRHYILSAPFMKYLEDSYDLGVTDEQS